MSKYGVKATSSFNLFPDVPLDTNQIMKTVQENGFDGILVIRLLCAETKTHYVQGYFAPEMKSRYNPFKNKYSTNYQGIQHFQQ